MNFTQTNTKINLKFVRAQQKDVDLLFGWINDPEARTQSLSCHTITYEEHVKWFINKISDKNCYLYIIYEANLPVGMIRFDLHAAECIISYLVDTRQRGRGIGTLIIDYGIEQFKTDSGFTGKMKATVKNTNIASLKIFDKAEFVKENEEAGLVHFSKSI